MELLEYCDESNLIEREQHYMNLLKPEYNVLNTADSNLGFKHSEATIELFRSARLARRRGKYLKSSFTGTEQITRNTNKNRVLSEATILKLSVNNHKSICNFKKL